MNLDVLRPEVALLIFERAENIWQHANDHNLSVDARPLTVGAYKCCGAVTVDEHTRAKAFGRCQK